MPSGYPLLKRPTIKCKNCGKIKEVRNNWYKSKIKFCSYLCSNSSKIRDFSYLSSKKINKKKSIGKLAEKNPMWKGDKVGYHALHQWIKRRLKKPKFCQECKGVPPYDLANISNKYKRDLSDWEWLCRKCHMRKDDRINNLKQYNK